MRHWPITAIANVNIAGVATPTANFSFDTTLDPERAYVIYLNGGYTFTDAAQISITYTAGYAAPPADVAQAVIEWAVQRYKKKSVSGATQVRNLEGERSDVDPNAMPPNTQRVIEAYTRKWPTYGRTPDAAPAAPVFNFGNRAAQQGGR